MELPNEKRSALAPEFRLISLLEAFLEQGAALSVDVCLLRKHHRFEAQKKRWSELRDFESTSYRRLQEAQCQLLMNDRRTVYIAS